MGQLPAELSQKPFTRSQAAKQGVSTYLLKKLLVEGVIEQLMRGVYRVSTGDISEEDQFRAATLRVGSSSAICLVSALFHYHLTDTIPKKTWIMVPISKRTIYRDLKLLRTRNPDWNIGVEKREGYAITTLERTIIDCLNYRAKIGTQIGIDALRRAIGSKKTTLGKIMDVAVKLRLVHRIRPYIEALS
jgi:predicted transcriptional regulator of viral defense system